jgi:hypothetical protein
VGGRAPNTPASDAEIFFTSIFGAGLVLLAGELLFRVLVHGSAGPLGQSLIARAAPLSSVRPLYAFFVLLPAGLAFLAIGFPFFFRTVSEAARRRLDARGVKALLALGACIAAALIEVRTGGTGLVSVAATAAVGAWQARGALARLGERHGFSCLAAAGAALAGFAWYQWRATGGADPSIAIAPTLLVAAVFFAVVGLATATAAATQRRRRKGRISVTLCWLAVIAWLAVPLLRAPLAGSVAAADQLELGSSIGAGAVLAVIGVIQRLRS